MNKMKKTKNQYNEEQLLNEATVFFHHITIEK